MGFHEEVANVKVKWGLIRSRRKWRSFWIKEYVLWVEVRQDLRMVKRGPVCSGSGGQGSASSHCRGKGAIQMSLEVKVGLPFFSLNKKYCVYSYYLLAEETHV